MTHSICTKCKATRIVSSIRQYIEVSQFQKAVQVYQLPTAAHQFLFVPSYPCSHTEGVPPDQYADDRHMHR
jgi:hypothetical protein